MGGSVLAHIRERPWTAAGGPGSGQHPGRALGRNTWTIVDSADVPDQSSYMTSVATAGLDDVWAVGGHRPTGDVRGSETTTLIKHWDGSSWRIVPSPDQAQRAELGVAALSSGEVWLVGAAAASQAGQGELQGVKRLIESWDCS